MDVRDLATWLLDAVEHDLSGTFNATNQGVPWGELLAGAKVTWVSDDFLRAQEVGEWMELPLWVDTRNDEWRHFLEVDTSRAVEAGMTFRPLDETVAATLQDAELVDGVGLTPEREAELLAAWWGR